MIKILFGNVIPGAGNLSKKVWVETIIAGLFSNLSGEPTRSSVYITSMSARIRGNPFLPLVGPGWFRSRFFPDPFLGGLCRAWVARFVTLQLGLLCVRFSHRQTVGSV